MFKLLMIILIYLLLPIYLFSQYYNPIGMIYTATGQSVNQMNILNSSVLYYSTATIVNNQNKIYSGFWYLLGKKLPVTIKENNNKSSIFWLSENFPNPVSDKVSIKCSITDNGNLRIVLFDYLGGKVGKLINKYFEKGSYTITFSVEGLPDGVYFYQAYFKNKVISRKIIISK